MQFYQKRRENCVKTHVILKKASFYACLTLFAGMAFPMPLWASQSTAIVQQHVKQITGIVNDTSGAPVIGANVVEVGSTNGTITDVDGKFTLNVSVGAKLKVSYIGYNDQQITVGNSNSYTIILKEDTESLDEVVVVGYGTQKKVNLTGSVATISSDKLVNRTSANVTNMLAGQMPGVTIIQNTGQPGADAGVLRVRGLGTMGDASAMVVVDGVESTMSSVDPNDIENISILKDAAASAIYGVRAANHLSIKGGGDKVTYSLAFNYHDKDGLIVNTNYNKFNVRANIDAQINSRLKLTTNMAVYRSNMTAPAAGISNLMHYAFRETPVTPIQLSNGNYALFKNEHNSVAYAREGGTYKEINSNFQGNVGMELDIIDGLKLRGVAASTFNLTDNPTHVNTMTFYQAGSDTPVKKTTNSITEYDIKSMELNLQAYLDYNKTFGKHTIGALLGYSQIYKQTRYLQAYRKNLPNSNSLDQINAGEVTGQTTYGTEIEYALRSAFGRVNYSYDDRYLLEANLRYDGTSRFPKNNRFGAFPSFSIGWRISEEEFFKADWVDNLKLRASWGLLGNQETVNSDNSSNYYPYQNTYLFGYDYSFGNTLTPGISISNPMANQDITWEKTDQWNVGVDAAFWGNKLTLGADWFRKETRDILLQLPVPNMMGVSAPMQNAGVVRNTGIELQLGHNNRINDWSYSIGANFSYVTTKIMDLKGGDTPGQSVGDPLWAYYGYVCDGIFQNEEEIKNHPTQSMGTPVPGDLKYRDLNGDKVVDSKDRQVLGSYFPKINFGLNLSVQYKDFDLSALLQGAADVKSAPVAEIRYAFYNGGKVTEQHLDRWTPENPNATYPRLSMSDSKNRVTSSFWMQDASYAKLRNLQVGYSLPKQLISKYGISRLRVYCSIDNLFMISGFDGVDPEAISGNYYPLTRNYSFGLNVTF